MHVQNLAPFGCFHEFVRIVHRADQNIDLLFSRPKFAHLAVQNYKYGSTRPVWMQGGTVQGFIRKKICPHQYKT